MTVIIGRYQDVTSPVEVAASMLYLDVKFDAGVSFEAPADYDELALYVVAGEVDVDEHRCGGGTMAIARDGRLPAVRARGDAHIMFIGGEPLGPRHIWWNFVSASRERIERAKDDWRNDRFDRVPGEKEFIPLPED